MTSRAIETTYPLTFREHDARELGRLLKLRNSVELVGIKRVGISNFLRFFLYHHDVVATYIDPHEHHVFIPVDLNDLIEREIHPFWILTFKRLLDVAEKSERVSESSKKTIASLFLRSIQAHDLFLTLENIKQATEILLSENILPTFFLIRFDRIEPSITQEFFNNLQGFVANSNHKVSFVFTSFRPLDQIKPSVFDRRELTSFSHIMHVKPAKHADIAIIYSTLKEKFNLCFTKDMEKELLRLSGGHVQYLHLLLIILHEKLGSAESNLSRAEIFEKVSSDERIRLQSEEIWESLTKKEQISLKKVTQKKQLSPSSYLADTGIVTSSKEIFSPLLAEYIHTMSDGADKAIEFSKKEFKLYNLFLDRLETICDRDTIIAEVWPEYEEVGVSDWTIDRLVARLRAKMTRQESHYSIITVKTRGYKLVQT